MPRLPGSPRESDDTTSMEEGEIRDEEAIDQIQMPIRPDLPASLPGLIRTRDSFLPPSPPYFKPISPLLPTAGMPVAVAPPLKSSIRKTRLHYTKMFRERHFLNSQGEEEVHSEVD